MIRQSPSVTFATERRPRGRSHPDRDSASLAIALVITSLGGGGAERVVFYLATYLHGLGHRVSIVTLMTESRCPFSFPTGIERKSLDVLPAKHLPKPAEKFRRNGLWVGRLRKYVRTSKPDVVLSFMDQVNVLTLLATFGMSLPVVVSEQSDPAAQPLSALFSGLRRMVYPLATTVVALTPTVESWLRVRRSNTKIRVIPNGIPSNYIRTDLPTVTRRRTLVAIGRLSHEKGFDLLLEALSRVELHDWTVEIFGEGPSRSELERRCLHLGLSTRVTFKGWTEKPANELDRAGLFVMPSRHEGFPNVLLEAFARGVPVISFDCPSGPRHIIRNNEDGLLVPAQRVDLLATAISRALEDPDLRQTFSENALKNIRRFEQYKIEQQWLDTLCEAASTRVPVPRT